MSKIDYTKCKYNTFDGGGTQRTMCTLDWYYCDSIDGKDCYYKQLQRAKHKLEKIEEIANNNNCLKCPFSERCNYDCGNCEKLKLENIKEIIEEEL